MNKSISMNVKLPKAKKKIVKRLTKLSNKKNQKKRLEDITIASSEIGQEENYENLTARFTVQNYPTLAHTQPVSTASRSTGVST